MKKTLSVILSLMMIACFVPAMAQDAAPEATVYTVEAPAGETFGYANMGFMMTMPEGFAQVAVTDEDKAAGAFDNYSNGTNVIQLRAVEAPEGFDFVTYFESLKTTEGVVNSELSSINEISWINYLTSANQLVSMTMLSETVQLYVIAMPADTEGFAVEFQKTLGSIAPFAVEAE